MPYDLFGISLYPLPVTILTNYLVKTFFFTQTYYKNTYYINNWVYYQNTKKGKRTKLTVTICKKSDIIEVIETKQILNSL